MKKSLLALAVLAVSAFASIHVAFASLPGAVVVAASEKAVSPTQAVAARDMDPITLAGARAPQSQRQLAILPADSDFLQRPAIWIRTSVHPGCPGREPHPNASSTGGGSRCIRT